MFCFVREREIQSASTGRQSGRLEAEGEAGSLPSKEPDVGLDPRRLGS